MTSGDDGMGRRITRGSNTPWAQGLANFVSSVSSARRKQHREVILVFLVRDSFTRVTRENQSTSQRNSDLLLVRGSRARVFGENKSKSRSDVSLFPQLSHPNVTSALGEKGEEHNRSRYPPEGVDGESLQAQICR